jgi:hypothetical protein
MALADELGEASERLSAVSAELQSLSSEDAPAEELAVFADPTRLRAERITARRRSARTRG